MHADCGIGISPQMAEKIFSFYSKWNENIFHHNKVFGKGGVKVLNL